MIALALTTTAVVIGAIILGASLGAFLAYASAQADADLYRGTDGGSDVG